MKTMKTSTALGVGFGAFSLFFAGLCFEAWLLGSILSWFNVTLTFWQNLTIIALANLIFKPTGVSSK